ncbi:TonB-dependent receptor [Pedobacter nutrimenti]|uniref:SusC/RagA family TonB-linked outer membrane protein n=1 Tax=Pedobacter nutrimenti TaxID=1241337 RepID=UPI002931DD7F|nr:TonB-dependent receptor [Pedobacter nutrimenti]
MRLKILPLVSVMLLSLPVLSQNLKKITGKINDNTGRPLPGASIQIIPENKTATAGSDGRFVIEYKNTGSKLRVSYIGFKAKEYTIANIPQPLIVSLETDDFNMDELVVIGYESKRKVEITTSTVKVDTKNNTEGGYSNFQQLIGGRAAGVNVMENSADPGGGVSIEIRGVSSLSFSTQPLYVVDGVPLYSPELSGLNNGNSNLSGYGTSNPLSMINPNDIESIDILKDAAATAIYGARGSNGVVLVTTKSGRVGKMKISLGVNRSYVNRSKEIEMLTAKDYATFVNEAWAYRQAFGYANATLLQPYLPSEIDSLKSYNHQQELQRTAPTSDVNLSISGGDHVNKFYISGQYYLQDGILPSTSLKRYNGKFSYEGKLSSKLTFTASANYSNTTRNGQPSSTLTGKALSWAPTSPLTNPDGDFNYIPTFHYGTGSAQYYNPNRGAVIYYNPRFPIETVLGASATNNPLSYSGKKGVQNINPSSQLLANFGLSYNITNDLKLSGLLGITTYNALLENYVPITMIVPASTQRGVASLGNSQNNSVLYQVQANYNKRFGANHNFSAVLVGSAEKFVSRTQTASAEGFTSDLTSFNSIQSGNSPGIPNSTYSASQLVSSIFRGSYNYKTKYYLSASGRYDGSSKFTAKERFGFFPSVSGAWRIDQEEWFKKTRDVVSELKLRGSWGLVGNQAISPYSTISTLDVANVIFGNTINTGFAPNRLANPELRWEKTSSVNLGADLSFFKNRFSITADVYRKYTDGLLFNVTPPLTTGYSTYTRNIASLTNKGIELTASAKIISRKNLNWSVDANIAFNRNRVEKLAGATGEYLDVANVAASSYLFRIQPGEPVGQFYGYKTIGVWTDETILTKPTTFQVGVKEGTRRYADLNNDGYLNEQDRSYLGSALPKFFGGFSTNLSYKNLELVAFFSYSVGNKIFNYYEINYSSMAGTNNIQKDIFDKRYRIITPGMSPEEAEKIRQNNRTTMVQVAGTVLDPRESTDYYIEDGSYLRCRDITLSYLFPEKWLKGMKLASLKAYVNVQNPFTITKYSGYNPEVNTQGGLSRGVDGGTTPMGRGIRFGLNANF